MTNRIILQLLLLWSCLCAVHGFLAIPTAPTKTVVSTTNSCTSGLGAKTATITSLFQLSNTSEDDENDGWGDGTKMKELQALQQDRVESSATPRRDRVISESTGQERDLFIPIFAIVSLLGLFGAYGYEMLRLYSRGELYLPF